MTEAPTSVLLAVGDLLRAEVDVDTLLARIVDLIVDAMDADRGTLFLADPKTGELYSKVAHLPELPEIRLQPGQGVAGDGIGQLRGPPDRARSRGIDDLWLSRAIHGWRWCIVSA